MRGPGKRIIEPALVYRDADDRHPVGSTARARGG